MRGMVRIGGRSAAVALTMTLAGALSASAYSYGALSVSHDGAQRGKGYGTLSAYGWNSARLTSWLADTKLDGTRTFVSARAYGNNDAVAVQSGRRTDGESWYAQMATKYGYAAGSTTGWYGNAKVCQDVPNAPDWCSAADYGYL